MSHDSTTVDNIIEDMRETEDWATISDALGANGINSHHANREDVERILNAVLQDDRVYVGTLESSAPASKLTPVKDTETTKTLTDRIFNDSDPVFAMMNIFIDEVIKESNQ